METTPRLSRTKLASYQKLAQKKYREAEQKFLVEGSRLVQEALGSNWKIEALLMTRDFLTKAGTARLLQDTQNKQIQVYMVSEAELTGLSDTVSSQGVIAVVCQEKFDIDVVWTEDRGYATLVALDDIADPGNLGTILRTCDWFGVSGILLNRNTVEVWNPKVVRSTMGSLFHLPIFPELDLPIVLQNAKRNGYKVVVTSLSGGKQLSSRVIPRKSIVVFGNEARGISEAIEKEADERITIPRFGKAESLNVAISCGIILSVVRMSAQK